MRDPNPVWPNERLRIAELEAERDRLRAEVEWLQGYAEGHDEALTHLSGELRNARAEVERLEERLAPCANWLRYAFKHVDSVTADHVKAWLAREPAG